MTLKEWAETAPQWVITTTRFVLAGVKWAWKTFVIVCICCLVLSVALLIRENGRQAGYKEGWTDHMLWCAVHDC